MRVVQRLARGHRTVYYLGHSYRGLPLVEAEVEGNDFASFFYANCTWLEVNSFSPYCSRVVSIDSFTVAPGDANTQGRCRWQGRVSGATVAMFPVNPDSLRVFTATSTVYVSGGTLPQLLRAAHALRSVREHAPGTLRARDVSRYLGTCKPSKPTPRVVLTAKQRYERAMKARFAVEFTGTLNLGAIPTHGGLRAVRADLRDSANLAPALRNMAYRIDHVTPPDAVASPHDDLVGELEHYADDVDAVDAKIRRGDSLDAPKWRSERPDLQRTLDSDGAAIAKTLRKYAAKRYSIFVKPSD